MGQRHSEGEFWKWARLAWDKPAGAVAAFVVGVLFYKPLPAAFEAMMRTKAQEAEGTLGAIAPTGYADATAALLPLIQMLATLLMAIAVLSGIKHLYRHLRPRRPQLAPPSRTGQYSEIKRRRRRAK